MIQCCVLPQWICLVDTHVDVVHVLCALFQWINLSVLHTLFQNCIEYYRPHEISSPKLSVTDLSMWELFLAGMWTVFILNFPSNLIILYGVDCWNSKDATQISLPFSVLRFLFMVLLKAAALYPFCWNVFLKHQDFINHTFCHILSWHD
jgi:hypothetical protein